MTVDDLESEAKLGAYDALKDEEQQALVTQGPTTICRHAQVLIDSHTRTLVCRSCEAKVDPISWLCGRAGEWSNWAVRLKRMRMDASELASKVQDAKRELKSLEGKIARRKKKLG